MSRGYNSAITIPDVDRTARIEALVKWVLMFTMLGLIGIILGVLAAAGIFQYVEPASPVVTALNNWVANPVKF